MTKYNCEECSKSYKNRSGLWKHIKNKHSGKITEADGYSATTDDASKLSSSPDSMSSGGVSESPIPTSDPSISEKELPPEDTPKWMDFDFGSDESTDTIPSSFKSILTPMPAGGSKLTKNQAVILETQNKGILKMFLTVLDSGLSAYGKAVSLDPDFQVRHSEADKELVSNAQYRWCEEKGFFLTNYLSTGMIASSLTLWYVSVPMYRIRKNAKKKLFKGRGLLSRLPLIGRLFKKKEQDLPDIGQTIGDGINES